MAINSGMYNRPMTKEEEERMMMSQSLRGNNNMMMADANMIGPGVMTDVDAQRLMSLEQEVATIKNKYLADPNSQTGGVPYMDEINRRALIGTDYTVDDPMINSYQDNFNNSMALQKFYDEEERRRMEEELNNRRTIDPYLGR
tara:strand:+ start:67 stop:495 length:429 start_codon:yes stop_codon:yes gene_type:complete